MSVQSFSGKVSCYNHAPVSFSAPILLIRYQCQYKFEAMRGLGVDRHLFGLYLVAKGMNLDPLPRMFQDKVWMTQGSVANPLS